MTLGKSPPSSGPLPSQAQAVPAPFPLPLPREVRVSPPPDRRGASHPGVHCPHGSLSGCSPAEVPAPSLAQPQAQTRGYRSRKLLAYHRQVAELRARPLAQGPPLIGQYETVTRMLFPRTPGSPRCKRRALVSNARKAARLAPAYPREGFGAEPLLGTKA